jgi:diguanylate cyclase (GGDEF)-like protein/PAS domain S-box-containing protein
MTETTLRPAAATPFPGLRSSTSGNWLRYAVGGVLVWIAVCLLLMVAPIENEFISRWIGWYDFPLGPLVVYLCFRICRTRSIDARARRGWLMIGLSYLSYWLGNCTWNTFEVILEIEPFPSIADVFFLSMYPFMFLGLLMLSEPLNSRREKIKFSLDVATIMVAASAFMAYFIVARVEHDPEQSLWETAILMAYPVGDILLAFGIVSVLLRRRSSGGLNPVSLLLLSQAAMFAADMFFFVQSLEGTYETGGIPDLCFILSWALMITACYLQFLHGSQSEHRPELDRPYPYRLSPYIAVIAGYGLLVWDHVVHNERVGSIPLPTALLLTSLVIIRQVFAARELAQLHASQAERKAEQRFASLVKHASDVVLVTDVEGTIRFATRSIERMLGWPAETMPGCNLAVLMHHEDIPTMQRFLREVSAQSDISEPVEWRVRNRDDGWQYVEVIASNLVSDPNIGGVVLNCRDVTDRRGLEDRLRHMAFHDPLTLLPNRNLFNDRVQQALDRSARHSASVAVMFVDLDNFKNINDSLGHEMGDNLLVAVAERLRRVVRPSDTVARLGGDEFAVLLEDFKTAQDLSALAVRMIDSLNVPVFLASKHVTVTGSIGIAIAAEGDKTQDIMRNADVAMYRAKARGKANYEFFEATMHAQILEHMEMEMDLRRALQAGEFVVHYQPVVNLQNNLIVGVEALVRWNHPHRGLVYPGTFIGVAEGSDLIVNLGRWVLFEACTQGRRWQDTFPSDVLQHISVNISARQLQHEGFVGEVKTILAQTGVRPESVVLEITESVLMQNVEWTRDRLRSLKDLGVRLALDDFGTGYSALSYLHQFPFDILKIDRSFVSKINDEATSDALVRTIVAMGYSLGLSTVAEGIENLGQLAELRRVGCNSGQGFLFSQAAPAEVIGRFLATLRVGPQLTVISSG